MKQILALLIFCSTIFLAGCSDGLGTSDDTQTAELIGTKWMLRSIDVPGSKDIESDPDRPYSIQFFEDLRIRGMNDCNEYGGKYTLSDDNSLNIGSLGATRIYCGDESIDMEYLLGLKVVYSYEIRYNRLRLLYDEKHSALNFVVAK